ncbi:hypothetical protein ACFVMC_29290 [Nocardia sp. NPDC127579]|uniref:hypothetical protein n=1 Tax=Nocardia sp. NPDC127579 TaxID=3345402 RepID=UPI0036315BED
MNVSGGGQNFDSATQDHFDSILVHNGLVDSARLLTDEVPLCLSKHAHFPNCRCESRPR